MLVVLCGIQGSGKTTLTKYIADNYEAFVYSCDEILKNNPSKSRKERDELLYASIRKDLIAGNMVVLDGIFTAKANRQLLLKAVEDIKYKKLILVLSTPLQECIKRNEARKDKVPKNILLNTNKQYDPPDLSEGWDEIIYV